VGLDPVVGLIARGQNSYFVLQSPDDPWRPPIRARKVVKGLSLGLTPEERSAVAQRAVDELRRHGDHPWKLEEELPKTEVHSTPKEY
jgi:hypothetical protein